MRKKYRIPPDGFISDTESDEWHKKRQKELDKYFESNSGIIKKSDTHVSIFRLSREINVVIKELGLPDNYDTTIEYFIKFNKILAPENINVVMPYNENLKRKQLFIQIFPETTIEDVKKVRQYKKGDLLI